MTVYESPKHINKLPFILNICPVLGFDGFQFYSGLFRTLF